MESGGRIDSSEELRFKFNGKSYTGFTGDTLASALSANGRFIRKVAGWGTAPKQAASRRYEHRFHHCDVLVVGAGPAGLAAALGAGRCGARVLLVDDQTEAGGYLLGSTIKIDKQPALSWVANTVDELDALPEVIRLSEASATGYYDQNFVTVLERQPDKDWVRERLWKVRARRVVLATGAIG